MQEECEDWYEFCSNNFESGCCLVCDDAEPGCLCSACMCSKCFWYTPPYENDGEHGYCDLARSWRRKK